MNQCNFIGRLTKEPELNTTQSGVSVARFSIAVDRKFKKEDGTRDADFFNCTAWRAAGETICKYAKKGSQIFVSGEMQNRSYDAEDGTKRYTTDLIVDSFQFLGSKNSGGEESQQPELEPIDDGSLPF